VLINNRSARNDNGLRIYNEHKL